MPGRAVISHGKTNISAKPQKSSMVSANRYAALWIVLGFAVFRQASAAEAGFL
jgi:hypothetical protein